MFLHLIQQTIDRKKEDNKDTTATNENPMMRAFNKFNQADSELGDDQNHNSTIKELNIDYITQAKIHNKQENEVRVELDQFSDSNPSDRHVPMRPK